jgi:hypothetical protein
LLKITIYLFTDVYGFSSVLFLLFLIINHTKNIKMLALDIGIKNLAYCIGEKVTDLSGSEVHIKHWSLVNLTNLNDEAKPVCTSCGKPAKAKSPQGLVCGRHLDKDAQIFNETTGLAITKAPTITQLQAFLKAKGLDSKGQRPALLSNVEALATMPLVKKKSVASFADNTSRLHDAIRGWIDRDWLHLKEVKQVYIEHQPVLKNPVMKTVQLLIFASLRERFLMEGRHAVTMHFVHAGKKVQGAEVGDAGYKDRKAGGEARAKLYLGKFPFGSEQHKWLTWWQAQHKKDDLADSFLQGLWVMEH